MAGVKERTKQISQSYVKLSDFERIQFDDGITADDLFPYDYVNIPRSIMGELVECLTRYMLFRKGQEAFIEAIAGAEYAEKIGYKDIAKAARKLLGRIKGLGDASIENAWKLLSFKSWFFYPPIIALYRVTAAMFDNTIMPETAENIRIFVKRSVVFFKEYGPVVKAGFIFTPKSPACTSVVDSGMCDFLTADTLWDMKLLSGRPSSKDTLQVLMYWIMGQHSGQEIFKGITKLGLYNPRQNVAYTLEVAKIPPEVIREVEEKVICY